MKPTVKKALLDEQGYICCYCGIRITKSNSHIEHFRPRHGPNSYPPGEIDYNNLHACCLPDRKDDAKPHCGMKKDDWFDPVLMISPLDPGCEQRFRFGSDGSIGERAHGDIAAGTTIKKLGLDTGFLVDHRKSALEASGLFDVLADATREQVLAWANALMQRQGDGKFTDFCFATADVLRSYA
jgi:uncharacterized protein (TIGR02646 family)